MSFILWFLARVEKLLPINETLLDRRSRFFFAIAEEKEGEEEEEEPNVC